VRLLLVPVHVLLRAWAVVRLGKPEAVEIVQVLAAPPMPATQAIGRGPGVALRKWQRERMNISETRAWTEEARLEAVLGSCRRSMPSVR